MIVSHNEEPSAIIHHQWSNLRRWKNIYSILSNLY